MLNMFEFERTCTTLADDLLRLPFDSGRDCSFCGGTWTIVDFCCRGRRFVPFHDLEERLPVKNPAVGPVPVELSMSTLGGILLRIAMT